MIKNIYTKVLCNIYIQTLHKRCENCEMEFFTVEAKHWKNVHFDLYNKNLFAYEKNIFSIP